MKAKVIWKSRLALCVVSLSALGGCAGSALVELGNVNRSANVNVNAGNQNGAGNANGNANQNANGNQNANDVNANANANTNSNAANGNVNSAAVVPPELTGVWVVAPDCGGGSTMNVMADGSITFEPIDPVISINGSVTFGGNFAITIVQAPDDPPLPGEPAGQCLIGLSGMLNDTGTVNGTTTRQCTGDPVGTPCSFVIQRF